MKNQFLPLPYPTPHALGLRAVAAQFAPLAGVRFDRFVGVRS